MNNQIDWEEIYSTQASKYLGICRRYIKDKAVAEDVLHDAFIQAMGKVDTFSGKGSIEAWLRRVVVNTALMHLRKVHTKEQVFSNNESIDVKDKWGEMIESDLSPRSSIEQAAFTQEELLEAIDLLPVHHKSVFNLYVLDNFKHREISDLLKITVGTSKSHLARARKKIQEVLLGKAQDKEQKRRRVAFLFVFPLKGHYLDKLYRRCFSSFEVVPNEPMTFEKVQTKVQLTSTPMSILRKLKTPRYIIGELLILALVISVFIIKNIEGLKEGAEMLDTESLPKIEQTLFSDTLLIKEELSNDTLSDNSVLSKPEKPVVIVKDTVKVPVIIKKPVVIRKKVIIKDTVDEKH